MLVFMGFRAFGAAFRVDTFGAALRVGLLAALGPGMTGVVKFARSAGC
jgi:hypothetical protein